MIFCGPIRRRDRHHSSAGDVFICAPSKLAAVIVRQMPQKTPRVFSPLRPKWIRINCATTKPHFGAGFGYVHPLGLLHGLGCLLCSYSQREAPHSPGPPLGLTRWQTVPLFQGIQNGNVSFFYARLPRAQIYLLGTKSNRTLSTVMTFEESWFNKFHDAIASASVQALRVRC